MRNMPLAYFMINNILWFGNRWVVRNIIREIIFQVLGKK
jgi:hypothetical protein